jgi:Amt family ammonium transporter
VAAGIFGATALGGRGGVALASQVLGTLLGIAVAFAGGWIVYGTLKKTLGIRLDAEEEFDGSDITIHKISASAERETSF